MHIAVPPSTTDVNAVADLGNFSSSESNHTPNFSASDFGALSSIAEANNLTKTRLADDTGPNQSLVTLLPSPQDAVTIVMNTFAWLWGAETPSGSVLRPDDTIQLLDLATISKGSPVQVAKTLLLFALYMQQLPNSFDETMLGFESVAQAIELIVARVQAFIMSHEDEASSLDGLESLLLLSTIHLNTGDIRKTWASFRRTLDMARLAGLQDSYSAAKRDSVSNEDSLRRRIWLSAACGDCYCSLLLGQEPGIGAHTFGPAHEIWSDPVAEYEANVLRRICAIMVSVAERNAQGLVHNEGVSVELSDRLGSMYGSLPYTWWQTPLFTPDRSLDSAQEPNRLLCQMWYFLANTFIELPIAFGRGTRSAHDSLKNCVDASRNILSRYVGLQHAKDQLSRCRGGEQAAFLSAVVLLLAMVQLRLRSSQKTENPMKRKRHESVLKFELDRNLIQQTITSFDARGKGGCREYVPKQCAEILSTMRDHAFSDDFFSPVSTVPSENHSVQGFDMESLIDSAIRPALDRAGPAARLLDLTFGKEFGPDTMKSITPPPPVLADLPYDQDIQACETTVQ